MKVYIDDNEDYRITYSSRDRNECLESMGMQPIIVESLADYTKQVRKEIVQEIKVRLREKVTKMEDDTHCYPQNAIHWQDVVAILDQIQGV